MKLPEYRSNPNGGPVGRFAVISTRVVNQTTRFFSCSLAILTGTKSFWITIFLCKGWWLDVDGLVVSVSLFFVSFFGGLVVSFFFTGWSLSFDGMVVSFDGLAVSD